MVLVTPVYAEIAMSPYKMSIKEKGQTLRVDFGLIDEDDASDGVWSINKANSVIIYDQKYGLRATPKAEGYDAQSVTEMQAEQIDFETFTGSNNVANV